ncbi:MAG: ABC transporter ATP-binding protein [Candidatus Omnitrophica bacterium]|nr:ABC transporter ATP-binding protein [Candidatus Omnitrophota bacterium]MDD5653907.1 ABC transporter ATP-binding protein [Candidatus Omnitrophota bacterium]
MSQLLKINNLSGGYHQEAIVRDVSFEVNSGDFLGVIGPNGSGKTTLLRLLSRVLPAQRGSIFLQGQDIRKLDLKEFCQKVAFVQQDTAINFSFTVWEIVLMGRIPHLKRLQPESLHDREIAQNALIMTDTTELKEKAIDELSSGERQRAIIAKALTQEPVLLFLDEPTSHLDIGHQIQILDLLKKLNRQNDLTIVMVLHDLNLASEYCNRILLLDKGKVYREGAPEEVLNYRNIEAVYKTVVVVKENPISKKPYCILVPEEERKHGH